MFVFLVSIIGIAIFDGPFVKFEIFGVPTTFLVMASLAVSYFRLFILKRNLKIKRAELSLIFFEFYALLIALISYTGLRNDFLSDKIIISSQFITRQAYYLFVLPAIFLFQDDYYTSIIDRIIKKYGCALFWCVYLLHMIYYRRFAISVPTEFFLAWLALYMNKKTSFRNVIADIVVLFTPIAIGGEFTNLLIRVLFFIFLIIFSRYRDYVVKFGGIILLISIAAIYIIPWFNTALHPFIDENSYWRLIYWKDELIQIVKSGFLGVGYGTSYASRDFVGSYNNIRSGPFAPTDEYTTMDKLFVVGPHNSFMSITFRLGIIGALLFCRFLWYVFSDMIAKGEQIAGAIYFSFFASLVIIAVNVGIESPYYLFIYVFSMGMCVKSISVNKSMCFETQIKRSALQNNKK